MDVMAGDQVILFTGYKTLPRFSIVKRVTPTGRVVLEDYYDMFYSNGKVVGGGFQTTRFIQEATPENIAAMEQEIERLKQQAYKEAVNNAIQAHVQNMTLEQKEALLQHFGLFLPVRG